jgi:hypothetical protein
VDIDRKVEVEDEKWEMKVELWKGRDGCGFSPGIIPYGLVCGGRQRRVSRGGSGEVSMSLNKPKDCSKVKIYYSTGDDTWTQPASHMPDTLPYSLTWISDLH